MSHRTTGRRTIKVGALARVEGEGALRVRVRDGRVEQAELQIYEPPRFFEGFLQGRAFTEPPDITARICGICPVAYQMSACQAIEAACGVEVTPGIRALRRLLYCGEWIESHALHVHLLHAPDFLGYPGAIEMARAERPAVERGLAIKKLGNDLVDVVGGRPVHPVNVRVGGFHRLPERQALAALVPRLDEAVGLAEVATTWVAGFDAPELAIDTPLVALHHPDEYPMLSGDVGVSDGRVVPVSAFSSVVQEAQVPHSTALHARLTGSDRPYLVGPWARFALHADHLRPRAAAAARTAGLDPGSVQPFRSIVVRAVEVLHALEEAEDLVAGLIADPAPEASVPVEPRAGTGHGASEAPRGLLYHRYELARDGTIRTARIVPPTSQNQPRIEDDLRAVVEDGLHLDHEALTRRCEQSIRNYDPCISCATHFLDLDIDRG